MPHKSISPSERVPTSTSAVPPNKTNSDNKLAMSRALGAAFLSHQVEQLEKSVSHQGHANLAGRRDLPRDRDRDIGDRRQPFGEHTSGVGGTVHKRGPANHPAKQRAPSGTRQSPRKDYPEKPVHKAHEYQRETKDADLIVLDASVPLKKWCKEGREEIVIVPLEALNTLDLLKKGASPLAQRARVQRDDAFVPWDRIEFKDTYSDEDGDKPIAQPLHLSGSPEWVRRMICCARWEVDNVSTTLEKTTSKKPQVVLAVLGQSSALAHVGKTTDCTPEIASPVPLPAPGPHSHKYEPRSAGLLVAHWAAKAGIELLEVEPCLAGAPPIGQFRNGDDDERGKRQGGRGRRNSHTVGSSPATRGTGLVERPAAVMQMMEMVVRVLARGEKLEP
ncbi:hypothetical protein F5J12DRAFT_904509 [Pisolithus orientalis]|uniref:uncharacterized protein n=1 Tax=Pisolithus orientalis TaxID=936130 RepID=UPI00222599DA|nr:uncharacterized protein F5J12DRAFT_904509 [Pisolithus orientalis]KAI6015221.1 hypothetical protein F5J12DRAFT_904509 [Pisolithus orientalis]